MLLSAFLPIALAAMPPARVEASVSVAAYGSGYQYHQGAQYEGFLGAGATMRAHPASPGSAAQHFVLETGVTALAPVRDDGATGGVTSVVRVGYESPTLTITAGVHVRADATPAPLMPLPSLLFAWRRGPIGFSLAVLEHPLGALARIGIDSRYAGISYAAPAGAEAYVRVPLGSSPMELEVRGFGYSLLNTGHVGGTVSLVIRAGGSL